MNPVRPQNTPESPTLFNDLKAEVSAESAPLLQLIVRNSGLIVGVVVVLLVALVGTAVWRWHQGGLQAEAQTELARIGITMKGGDRLKALDDLAAKAPENMRYSIYLMQAEFAMQDQDYSRAGPGEPRHRGRPCHPAHAAGRSRRSGGQDRCGRCRL